MKNCSVCKSTSIEKYIEIEELPLLIFPVNREIKDNIVTKRIITFHCNNCNHIFSNPLNKEDTELIYTEYYKYYPYENLESMQRTIRIPFELFIDKVLSNVNQLEQKSLLEIGCSSGEPLELFDKYGLTCFGIDPSPLNTNTKFNIFSGYYETFTFSKPFHFIISRFNLEHLNDLHLFFQKTTDDLNDDGYLIIQVPNVKVYAETQVPLFLAHEHIQYFNEYSFWYIAKQYNYSVVEFEYKNSQTLLIALQKNGLEKNKIQIDNLPPGFYSDYLVKRELLANKIRLLFEEKSKILFYGAGLSLNWILYELKFVNQIQEGILFDDNPIVHGSYMPHSNIQAMKFDEHILCKYSTVLLTLNPAYHNDIIEKINKTEYQGNIYAINKEDLIKLK